MGHYSQTTSILTDITRDNNNSPCRNLDIQKNIVCQRCNGIVAGPHFSTCQCSVPLLGNVNPAIAPAVARGGGLTTLLKKVTSTFVDGTFNRGKIVS